MKAMRTMLPEIIWNNCSANSILIACVAIKWVSVKYHCKFIKNTDLHRNLWCFVGSTTSTFWWYFIGSITLTFWVISFGYHSCRSTAFLFIFSQQCDFLSDMIYFCRKIFPNATLIYVLLF